MTKLSPAKRDILTIVMQHPGITAEGVAALVFMTTSNAQKHLAALARAEMLSRRMIGRTYHYTRRSQ